MYHSVPHWPLILVYINNK